MLSLEEAKILISAYKYIDRRCAMINDFIYKHAINYGPNPEVCSTMDIINNIVSLMDRKVKLTELKEVIDDTIADMKMSDRQILLIKMKYRTSVKNIQAILKLPSERTTFRRIDSAMINFCNRLNASRYIKDIEEAMRNEKWKVKEINETKEAVGVSL